jgi:hypothetical protein
VKLTTTWQLKNFCALYITRRFITISQQLTTNPYHQPDEWTCCCYRHFGNSASKIIWCQTRWDHDYIWTISMYYHGNQSEINIVISWHIVFLQWCKAPPCQMGPLSPSMVRVSPDCLWRRKPPEQRIAKNISSTMLQTANKKWSSSLWVQRSKQLLITKDSTSKMSHRTLGLHRYFEKCKQWMENI